MSGGGSGIGPHPALGLGGGGGSGNSRNGLHVRMWAPNPDLRNDPAVAGLLALDPRDEESSEERGVFVAVIQGAGGNCKVTVQESHDGKRWQPLVAVRSRPSLRERLRTVGRCLRDLWQALGALVGIVRAASPEDVADSIIARQPAADQAVLHRINRQLAEDARAHQARAEFERRYRAALARGDAHAP